MAWLTSEATKRTDQAVYNFRVQYAVVDAAFMELFDISNVAEVSSDVREGDEVVRRIRQNIIDEAWPGLDKTFAQQLLQTLRVQPEYKNPTARWNGAGGYDVTATKILVDPAGWGQWLRVQDSEKLWA